MVPSNPCLLIFMSVQFPPLDCELYSGFFFFNFTGPLLYRRTWIFTTWHFYISWEWGRQETGTQKGCSAGRLEIWELGNQSRGSQRSWCQNDPGFNFQLLPSILASWAFCLLPALPSFSPFFFKPLFFLERKPKEVERRMKGRIRPS